MKSTEKIFSILMLISTVILFNATSGCGDSGGNGGDYDVPEFEWDGPGEDGDDDLVTDGDTTEAVDGDLESDGDTVVDGDTSETEFTGSISGKVTTSQAMAGFDAQVQIFNKNPMVEWGVAAYKNFDIEGDENTVEEEYSFEDLPAGVYYVWVYIDVNNNDDETDDVFAVYPQYVKIDPANENYRDRSDVNMFVDTSNDDLGSISGTLHLAPAYQTKRILVVTTEYETTNPEFWPNSVTFTEPAASETRTYNNTNLTNGTYYTMLYVYPSADNPVPLAYRSPYDSLKIDVEDNTKKDYTDQHFYMGIADPNFGSISGNLILPTAIDGEIGVYLFASNQSEEVKTSAEENSQTLLLLSNDGTSTSFPYTVGNLKSQDEVWVGGYINLDEDHIGMGYYLPEDLENPLSIDLDGTKDLTGIDFEVAITEMSGTLSVTHDKAPVMVKLALVDIELDIPNVTVNSIGGVATVTIEDPTAPIVEDYTMFPTYGGEYTIMAVIYTEKDTAKTEDGDVDDEEETPSLYDETSCYKVTNDLLPIPETMTVDGTQRNVTQNINLNTSTGWYCQ